MQASNALLKFLLLLDHFDSLVRYFYLVHEIQASRKPSVRDKPTLGWWVNRLQDAVSAGEQFKEVTEIAQREKVVTLRNDKRGHGWISIDPSAYNADAKHLEQVVASIEDKMAPLLESHRLLILRQTQPRTGSYFALGEELTGCHPLHLPFEHRLGTDPVSVGLTSLNEVYISDLKMKAFHLVSPFIRSAICPDCQHPRILITDGGTRYIDVFMGHCVDLKE